MQLSFLCKIGAKRLNVLTFHRYTLAKKKVKSKATPEQALEAYRVARC
jgi:hypothetical protein